MSHCVLSDFHSGGGRSASSFLTGLLKFVCSPFSCGQLCFVYFEGVADLEKFITVTKLFIVSYIAMSP